MGWDEDVRIERARNEVIVKDNRLLQTVTRRKYELKVQEQKIVGYLLSLIKPEDKYRQPPYLYTFDISTFCDVCGIDRKSGSNVQSIRTILSELSDRKFWIDLEDEKGKHYMEFQWIVTPDIYPGTSKIEVEIPTKTFPYLVGLTEKFTEYELWQILPMKSTFSIALFELLKSYAYKHTIAISLDDLRKYLGIEGKYSDFKNFKQKVLNTATKEINELTDITIEWEGVRDGKSYAWVRFTIEPKQNVDVIETYRRSKAILNGVKHTDGQINLFE